MPERIVEVHHDDLMQAFKSLAILYKKSYSPDLVVFTKDDMLFLTAGSMTCKIPAEGSFDGVGYLKGSFIKSIKSLIPDIEKISIIQTQDRIGFSNLRFSCRWESSEEKVDIRIPLGLSFIEILGLKYKYSLDELKLSGYLPIIEKSEKRKEELIDKAHDYLYEFRVSFSEIESLVENKIKEITIGK